MKKQLTVALGLAVLATPAFATKARLLALGEDVYGSAYINDNRNIWLNAAQINNHKDLVTYEFGGNGNTTTSDSSETSRGEGGLYKSFGNMVYGLHFGSQSNTANALRAGAGLFNGTTGAASVNEENNIDGFVGGDAGVKWGVNLGYARTKNDETTGAIKTRGESLRTRLGVIMGDTQAYANINLINNAKGVSAAGTGANFDGKLGYQVGVIHAWEGNTLFADWRQFDAKGNLGAGAGNDDIKLQQGYVGIGRVERLNDKTNLFMKAQYLMASTKNDVLKNVAGIQATCLGAEQATICGKYKTNRVPVTIGLETEATSWLTLRASVSQVVWGNEKVNSGDRGVRNSTGINAGATLKFGELSVDGMIGNSVGGDVAGSGVASNSTASGNGTIRTDVLMSRVGMTYRF